MSNVPPPDDQSASIPPPPSPSSPPSPSPSSPPPPPPPPPSGLTPPPGYSAYDNVAASGAFQRIGGLATALVVSTIVVGLGGLVTALLSAGITTDATNFLAGDLSDSEFEEALVPLNSVQLLVTVATLTTAVLTIIWAYRIAKNVRAAGRSTTWSPLFAVFGWFLPPGVLYVIPFLVLRELWQASDPSTGNESDGWRRSGENPVLWVWFVLFGLLPAALLAVQIGSLATGGLPNTDLVAVAESLDDFGALGWVAALGATGAAAAWVVFVRQLTSRHRQLTNEN